MSESDSLPSSNAPTILRPEEIWDEILLTMVDGVGPLLTQNLLRYFGSPTAVLDAPRDELLRVPKIGEKLSRQIADARKLYHPDEIVEYCEKESITILSKRDARYPQRLREIADPPSILYVKGTIEPEDAMALAVVGTRGISYYGRKQTDRIVRGLVQKGFTVVSGLARGIDGAAHQAALNAGGRTLAVLGSGLAKIFPPEHKKLAEDIAEQGAVMSELAPYAAPLAGNFPQRNRIVSGLSLGVIVVESPRKSGSLITARLAMEQNREVFAVPGPIDVENSRGCHLLIKDGAHLVDSMDDILEAIGPLPLPVPVRLPSDGAVSLPNGRGGGNQRRTSPRKKEQAAPKDIFENIEAETDSEKGNNHGAEGKESPSLSIRNAQELQLNERERKILTLLDASPKSVDMLIAESGVPTGAVLAVISVLEAKGIVTRMEGNRVRRV